MKRKTALVLIVTLLTCLLSGCYTSSTGEYYKLPKPPAKYENLMKSIAKTKRELATQYATSVEDVVPSAGDNTAAVQLLDMDGDGVQETAVSFLRVVGVDMPIRICFYTLQEDESYLPDGVIMGQGDNIHAIHYEDLDGRCDPETEKPWKEVVVSWQMGSNAYYLGVYAWSGDQTVEIGATAYQQYQLADLDQDGRMELCVCHVDKDLQGGQVEIYNWNESQVAEVTQANLSRGVTSVLQMSVNRLESMVPALYITGAMADDTRVVDIITCYRGVTANLALDSNTGISREQLGGYKGSVVSDVNSDNIAEIARPRYLPFNTSFTETWVLDWVQYNVDGKATLVFTTYHSTSDGWYLILPDEWIGEITIHRSDSVIGQRAVVFSHWDKGESKLQPFLYIYKFTGDNRNLRATSGNRFILAEDSSAVYAAAFLGTWNSGLDENSLLDNFRLIISSWFNE